MPSLKDRFQNFQNRLFDPGPNVQTIRDALQSFYRLPESDQAKLITHVISGLSQLIDAEKEIAYNICVTGLDCEELPEGETLQ